MSFTRILFVTDVHGSDPVWRKFIRGAQFYKADILILGGDVTGKNVVEVLEDSEGKYSCEFQGQKHEFENKEDLAHFDEIVRRNGAYMYLTTRKEMSELARDKIRADKIFSELILERLVEWIDYAESNATTPVYVNAGNDDEPEIDIVLSKSTKVVQPEDKVIDMGNNHEMISAGFANITPWHCPRDFSEQEIERRLEAKISRLRDPGSAIFNFHCPPVDSGLDTCVKLDGSFSPPKPLMDGGGLVMFGAGSTSVRAMIQKYQPMLGLHGHIHESKNYAKIGKTVCINPGSEYGEGVMRGVLVNFDEKGFKSYQFVSG